MPAGRHRAERRPVVRRTLQRLAGPAALIAMVAGSVVTAGVTSGAGEVPSSALDLSTRTGAATEIDLDELAEARERRASRSAARTVVAPQAVLAPRPTDHQFATEALNVWTRPGEQGPRAGLLEAGTRLAVTGQRVGHWAEVLLPAAAKGEGPRVRWVNADFLARKKPVADGTGGIAPTAPTGISSAPCPDGSTIESGITSSAVRVYRAVCAAFPALSSYGGYDPHGEHIDGRAIDFMVTDSSLGQGVADFLLAHAGELGVRDIIWAQHIWTPEQASAGWRYMSDRGSATANHYDHVHVAVF